jgi:hypothetical protein
MRFNFNAAVGGKISSLDINNESSASMSFDARTVVVDKVKEE